MPTLAASASRATSTAFSVTPYLMVCHSISIALKNIRVNPIGRASSTTQRGSFMAEVTVLNENGSKISIQAKKPITPM